MQKRLLLALLLSTAILVAWSYLLPVKPPQTPASPAGSPTPSTEASPTLTPAQSSATPNPVSAIAEGPEVPHKLVIVKTPLYEVTFDSSGAVPTSWVIKKNKDSGRDIYSVASTKAHQQPLELIPSEGLSRNPRELPLQLVTGDATIDFITATRNFTLEGPTGKEETTELQLTDAESEELKFTLRDPATGLEVVKSVVFHADRYDIDLQVSVTRGGQAIPAKLKVGPSIGDQGVSHYTFYSVPPESITFAGGAIERHQAHSINENKNSPDLLKLSGPVDWSGVGDTYFAMVAIPARQADGAEVRTVAYEHDVAGKKEKRYLVTALLPVPADNGRFVVYTGPKDHYLLTDASQKISSAIGRVIDLETLIDYGWLRWLSRPLAVPILTSIKWLKDLTGSYGVAIILFTIVIYSLFFPLKWRSSKAMKKAQKLAPKMKELQEKIKGMKQNDPRLKELQMEQLRLMKEGNPLGGCLPLLIQMPFLFALYRAITISLDFRQASFLWLPDLSAGDPFHILEILMAGTMIVLQLITPAPSADPLQRKMMAIGMPLFMLYVLWGAPSGLLVYWLVGNIVAFSQQFLINHWTKSDDDDAVTPSTPAVSKKKKPRPAASTT